MKAINVDLKGIKVASFSPSKEEVSFSISFNDGKDKEITKNVRLDMTEDVALQIIRDIRKVENSLHAEFDGKAVLDDYINIVIKDEDKVTEKLKHFISKVFEKIKVIKSQKIAEGYMSLINQVNSMNLDF
jgi:hypothetical protein